MSEPSEPRVVAGRYRLRRRLGQGSMGVVWEAYDEFLHRPVAVKEVRLPPLIAAAEADELRERTLREARAIAVVSHPNVITLHDVAREGDNPFVVMEYMRARSLADLLREFGPLEAPQAATVGYAVAAGLAAAHQAGITHRDVKPGNVLVADDGRVKLTDFGIARNVSELTLTRTGITLGSPAYIAPEVAAGREVTPAADLWGLGATLFAAVMGRAPYDPDGPVLATLSAVIHGEIPAASGPLAEVIGALMVKEPGDRVPPAEVRRMLHPLLPEPGTPLFPPSPQEAPTETELPVVAPAEPSPPPVPEPEPPAAEPAVLASDPGPLPFRPTPTPAAAPTPRRARRRGWRAALVTVLAIILFAGSAGGGFALARVIGGKPIQPPPRDTPAAQASAPLGEFVDRPGDASTLLGEQGGGFVVPVPQSWSKFVEQRISPTLTNSTVVRYLSPDGTQQLWVERFPGYYPKLTIDDYIDALNRQIPRGALVSRLSGPAGSGPEPGQQVTYRTVEVARNPGAGETAGNNRATFADLIPVGGDLWVLAVTVPVEQEDTGRAKVFERIAQGFKVTG